MKYAPIALVLSTIMASTPVFAQKDISNVFEMDNMQALQVSELSTQEMKDTQGAYAIPGAIAGGALGGIQYLGYAAGGGSFSWKSLGYNVGGGALMGAVGGPVGIQTFMLSRPVAFGVGMVGGVNRW